MPAHHIQHTSTQWLGHPTPVRRSGRLALMILLLPLTASANEALDRLERSGGNVGSATITHADAPRKTTTPTWQPPAWSASALDPVWDRATIYDNPENTIIQHAAVTGQYEWRIASGSAEIDRVGPIPERRVGTKGSLSRRARLGARVRAFNHTELEASGEFAGDSSHSGIERLAIKTTAIPQVTLRLGKFRPPFSNDFIEDPEHSPYPDRAAITHMLVPNRTLGATLGHAHGDWDAALGWFANDTDPWFPSVDSKGLLLFSLGHQFVETAGGDTMGVRWNLDYIHNLDGISTHALPRFTNGPSLSANGSSPIRDPAFRHIANTGVSIEHHRGSLNAGFSVATGDSKLWGLNLSPTWWAVPGTLRLVGRYQYASSDTAGGVITAFGPTSDPLRAEGPLFTGDTLHSFYLGANLHLYQDKLILMTGLERFQLGDDDHGPGFNTDGWIWHAGARLSF